MTATASPSAPAGRPRISATRILSRYGIVIVFLIVVTVLALLSSAFFTPRNIFNVLSQTAPLGIIACGSALVIIAGGFDLSVGALYGFSGVIAASVATASGNAAIGMLAGVLAGLLLGVLNGLIISAFGINSFIATLATGLAFGGLTEVITGGSLVSAQVEGYTVLGNERFLTIPLPVFVFALVAVIAGIVLAKGRLGRYIYAVGGNAEAAKLSGVRVESVRIGTFAISGLCAGIAGVIASSRVSSAQSDAGAGIELTAIAAVVVGGISISGGEGSIWRAVLGVMLIALIGNGFNILNIDPFYQSIAQGVIILIAVAADSRSGGALRRYWSRATRALHSRSPRNQMGTPSA